MRLEPIERPKNLFVRFMYWMLRRQFGKAITPWKVVFARAPATIWSQLGIYWALERGLRLDHGLAHLVQTHVARLNGCTFCVDIGRAVALYRDLTFDKVEALDDWRTSQVFTPAERAALAYVEEMTRSKRVDDATFAELRRHFDERAIVEITWLAAVENYFNLINLPLGIESDGLCAIAERRRAA
jgi:alkylhydroperoxidase family enzyme